MFYVEIPETTGNWYLRRTTWTSELDRADKFATGAEARAALVKAQKFMKAAQFRRAQIQEM